MTCSSHTQRTSTQNSNPAADIVVAHPSTSPAAKRKIAVAKALQAHRKQGQQNAAMHDIQQTQETDNKPKCGVCLDDMKEPACGTCG